MTHDDRQRAIGKVTSVAADRFVVEMHGGTDNFTVVGFDDVIRRAARLVSHDLGAIGICRRGDGRSTRTGRRPTARPRRVRPGELGQVSRCRAGRHAARAAAHSDSASLFSRRSTPMRSTPSTASSTASSIRRTRSSSGLDGAAWAFHPMRHAIASWGSASRWCSRIMR